MRTFEYRLYPTSAQRQLLMTCLIDSRGIYNEMLAAVKAQYEDTGIFPSKYDLTAEFKGRGGETVPASTVQMLADRLTKSLTRFLATKASGQPYGFPRFRQPNRWHSIPLRQLQSDFALDSDGKHLRVQAKLGKLIKIKLHRPLEGTPVTAHLVLRADQHWYVLIVCETAPHDEYGRAHNGSGSVEQAVPLTCEHVDIGLDVGLKVLLADSDGQTVANPRHYRRGQKRLAHAQHVSDRRVKGSHRRQKTKRAVARQHLTIQRQRRDHHYKTAKRYAGRYRRLYVEDLNVAGMARNHRLSKSIYDAGWSAFLGILSDKAARAGHEVIRIPARYTSQRCSGCGEYVQKSLSVRTHRCPGCGLVADRDVNAAKNILALGVQLTNTAGAQPSWTETVRSPVEARSPCL